MAIITGTENGETLNGTSDDDTIDGKGGNDTINGGDGNDSIDGGAGSDTIRGEGGDDILKVAGSGNDVADGGVGSDTLVVNYSGASYGIAMPDPLVADANGFSGTYADPFGNFKVSFSGIDHFDITTSTLDRSDNITTGSGNDRVVTNGGDDQVDVGSGMDEADGGAGTDKISADLSTATVDVTWNLETNSYSGPTGTSFTNFESFGTVKTGSGNDVIVTRDLAVNETIDSGAGDDQVIVRRGSDVVAAGAGDDTLVVDYRSAGFGITMPSPLVADANGFSGTYDASGTGTSFKVSFTGIDHFDITTSTLARSDNITTGSGNDRVVTNAGDDTVNSGAGDDLVDGGAGNDTLNGGDGIDTASYSSSAAGVTVSLAITTAQATGGAGSDTLTNFENLTGSAHNDTLTGDASANVIDGGAGDDTLNGGAGNDTLIGSAGTDTMAGGTDNDSYFIGNAGDQVIELAGEGYDIVYAGVDYVLTAGAHVEVLGTIDNFATTPIRLTGNELNNQIVGNAGANVLNGGAGADSMHGRGGNDRYHVDNAADRVWESAGNGYDTVYASVNYTLGAGQEIEVLGTANDTDPLRLTGNELRNVIVGNNGNNVLNGGAGADSMHGRGGNDVYYVDNAGDRVFEKAGEGYDIVYASVSFSLEAGQEIEVLGTIDNRATDAINLTGNDFRNLIVGNDGANRLNGGGGADSLHGRGGADTFVFDTALGPDNIDRINDFEAGIDLIELDDAVFAGLGLGTLDPAAFRTGSAAADADDRIIYNPETGALLFDADGIGGAAAIQFATLSPGLALSSSDFIVG